MSQDQRWLLRRYRIRFCSFLIDFFFVTDEDNLSNSLFQNLICCLDSSHILCLWQYDSFDAFFALSLSKSTNPMIKWLLSLFRSSDRVSVQNMTSQLGSLYPQFWRFSSSCPSDSSKEWYFLKCNFIISAHTLLLFQNDFRFFFIIFLSDGTISVNSLRTGRCFF